MSFETTQRRGGEDTYEDDADVREIIGYLFDELTEEEFDEADSEHSQIAVSHGDVAITVQVSGLVTLDDLSWITGSPDDVPMPSYHLRNVPDEELVNLLEELAQGNLEFVLKAGWLPFDKLPPYTGDFYRRQEDETTL